MGRSKTRRSVVVTPIGGEAVGLVLLSAGSQCQGTCGKKNSRQNATPNSRNTPRKKSTGPLLFILNPSLNRGWPDERGPQIRGRFKSKARAEDVASPVHPPKALPWQGLTQRSRKR
jgi:hypothetical protein